MIKLTNILLEILSEDRCKRIADRKYDKPPAYKSGAIVRCRKGNIWKDLKEDSLNEYSNKIINRVIDKFKQEDFELTDDEIKEAITRFGQIKDNLYQKDILKYTWSELIDTIIQYEPKHIKVGKLNKEEVNNADLVYNQNNIRVYKAGSEKACIKYGQGYSFCISSRGEENLYSDYRLGQDAPSASPYFVFDDNRANDKDKNGDFIDPTHLLVIMVYQNGNVDVTEANNNGSEYYATFEKVAQKYPQLKKLENILKYEPLSNNDIEFVKSEKDKAREEFCSSNNIPYLFKNQAINLLNNVGDYKIFEFTYTEKKTGKIRKHLYYSNDIDIMRNTAKNAIEYSLLIKNPLEVTFKEVPIEGKVKSSLQDFVKLMNKYDKQILKLKLQDLKENKNLKEDWQDTSWTGEKGQKVTLKQLLDVIKDYPIIQAPIEKVEKIIIKKDTGGIESDRLSAADIKHPIIIVVDDNNNYKYVLDGNHRANKAIDTRLKSIPAKLVNISKLPDEFQSVLAEKQKEFLHKWFKRQGAPGKGKKWGKT
jgi:hypothetical protein